MVCRAKGSGAVNPRVAVGAIAAVTMAAAMAMGFEGNSPTPYRDVGGVPTVCYGHTGGIESRRYSDDECQAFLKNDMAEANASVHRCITAPMTVGQEASLTDAAYNIGPVIVCGSTLQRKANAGDWAGACAELSRWVNAGGRQLPGLVRRRAAERALCEGHQ